ncbi:MAG: hypothetical protein CBE14_003505 [Rickettsiales bacterium TMED254]|nr:hypothetical protein [Rickettsiales bacterium]RPF75706.1 MAG: hypothetical protein CBE14_003505 [Rickettsiales bacterium TMED254]|tara:strand:- start:183 stop:1307 length:1125 start_codon:yes stop_codon:yes gene_type:complete
MKFQKIYLLTLVFIVSSCANVQEYIFPSLSDETLATPPTIDDSVSLEPAPAPQPQQYIPPSQYAPPPQQTYSDTGPTGTFVGGKINQFRGDLASIQTAISSHNNDYLRFKDLVEEQTTVYQGLSSAIRSRLQIGTTPGNPILVGQWNDAQRALEDIQNNVNNLQIVNNRVTADFALIGHLQKAISSSFFISGAIDEDHNQLKVLRDDVERTKVLYDRLMNELESRISREINILNDERQYMKNLAVDVEIGRFGNTVSSPPSSGNGTNSGQSSKSPPINYDNALVILKFDDSNLDYSAGLFETISSALKQNPSARFEIVAVSPTGGASFATKARDRAAEVLKQIVEMGVPGERLSLTSSNSSTAQAEEVHVYIKN